MSKASGGTRSLSGHEKAMEKRRDEYEKLVDSGKYLDSYFSDLGGGFVVEEKAKKTHKAVEWEAATILADNGYKVILKDETGSAVTIDGELISIGGYEQRTPELPKNGEVFNPVNNMKNALEHARDKNADIAVVYMKNRLHSRKDVEGGIKKYESLNRHRFKSILIITSDGRIHRHVHNK